jgi:hypothetical protein
MAGADGGTRTRTDLSIQRILSPLRLPFRHIGVRQQASVLRLAFLQAQNGYLNSNFGIWLKQSEVSGQSTGNFSSTGFAAGFGAGSIRSDLIPHDFKLPECPL